MDGLNQQAFDILTSSKLADALNVDSESQKTLDMYGTGTDKVFYENDIGVSQSYTITTGKNAMSAGPITLAANVVVTIPNGSVWSVV